MIVDTPEPEDQGQAPAETPEKQSPANAPVERAPQNGANQAAAPVAEQAGPEKQNELPEDEQEDNGGKKPASPGGPEPGEVGRRKERLEDALGEASAQREKRINERARQRAIEFGQRKISLLLLEEQDARREDQLFVEPPDYQRFELLVRDSTEKHILIVAGQESSGKFMAAFHVARHTLPKQPLTCYKFAATAERALLEIIVEKNLPENSVILFDEVFHKKQIKYDELIDRHFHLNERLADRTNIWFIFTVLDGPILEELQARNFPILSTRGVDRQQVLEKLIDYHYAGGEAERADLMAARGKLLPHLTPARLSYLFEVESDPKALYKGLTEKEEQAPETPYVWFSKLRPMNYQLYALLVVLFDKMDIPTLEDIYTGAANALRRQGMDGPGEFIDPRRIGTNLMHTKLGIQVRYNTLEFRNRLYRQYVEAQVENYQRLLWSLIDPDDPSTFAGLVGLIQRLSEYDLHLASQQQLRYAIAGMIAQVGVYHLPKLELLLDKLVSGESALVSLTASQVLAEIARRGTHFDFIEKLLKAWCQSGWFEQMWATATSIAYIYEAIARTLEEERAPLGEEEESDEEGEEESKAALTPGQKQRGKSFLAKLRDILTELVNVHDSFSEEAQKRARHNIHDAYVVGLKQQLDASLEPVTENDGRLFRDLSEREQTQILSDVYAEVKEVLDKEVERDLGVVINSWTNQMRMVLVQAMEHIAQMWPRDVTRLVRIWLDRKDREERLWQIGHMALNYLFLASITIKDATLLEQTAYPLLDLLPLAMRTHTPTLGAVVHDANLILHAEDMEESRTLELHMQVGNLLRADSLVYALSALQLWYDNLAQLPTRQENKAKKGSTEEDESEEDQDGSEANAQQKRWQQVVSAALANAMNNAPQEERQRLRSVLFLWVKSGVLMLNRIARILISHSYVMDGIVLDLPTSQRAGIVVIDGDRREQEDRERMFYLLQNLSALVPVHLHWLGYTRSSRLLNSDNRDEAEATRAEERSSSFSPDDLLLRSASRPSLLQPVLTSGQGQGYTPGRSYFVVVFHQEPILDLAELYSGLTDTQAAEQGNIFWQHRQRQKVAAQLVNQPWQGKLYLLPASSELTAPDALELLLTMVRPTTNIGMLEEELKQRIIMTLRACPASELWRELRAYIGAPAPQAPTLASLTSEIERWLEQLSDTSTLYPDVSLFILWTIMVRSLENLSEARQLIELMFQEPPEATSKAKATRRAEKAAKRARKLRQQMGIACTRMLFHFYGVENPALAVAQYGELLNLLPQVITSASSSTELLPILSVLFELARNDDWLHLLNDDEGALFEGINKVPLKELDPLRQLVKYYQHLVAMSRLFLEFNRPFHDFVAFGEDVFRRYKTVQARQQARNAEPPPGEMAGKFIAILSTENNEEERARYTWALQRVEFQQTSLRKPDASEATRAGLRNLEVLLNHLSNEFRTRQAGTIERLNEGEYFGIVMVEAQSKAAVHQAFLFVQEFVKQRREGKGQRITLMLQRLGEKELVAKFRTNRKIKNEREMSAKRQLPQVVGPQLERYPADQVAFVLLITASPIIDYDDWVEQEHWAVRLWLARLGKWHPYRGEMVSLGESTQLTLETLLKSSEGGRGKL